MKTSFEFLQMIKNDPVLTQMIHNSDALKRDYKPRKIRPKRRTQADMARDYFWDSLDGARFRNAIEQKLGIELSYNVTRGLLKDALLIFIAEIKHKQEQEGLS